MLDLLTSTLVLNADHSSALTMLLRYPSPRPHSPQTFVYDALSLQQSLTFETGRFIIAKYSGNAPSLSKRPSQASMETTTDKVHSRRDFKDSSEGNPSGRSLASSGPRSLETLLQDVSEGIQRRTETWGVAKAVRGAVTDARRNMHTMQWEARPRATRSEDITTFTPKEVHWAQESNATDLKTRVELLEERNKVLAKMLGQAFDDLRSHMAKVEVDADPASGIIQALTKVESVQICLENSSIPLESTDMYFSGSDDAGHKLGPKEVGEEKAGDDSSTEKTRVPPKSPIPPEGEKAKSRITSSSNRDTPISLPSRPTARPSLAESEFSWMLGGDRHLSSFASPASLPPEQTRQLDGKAKPGTLFSNGDEGERRGSAESDVAMNSLRGHKTGSRF